MYLVPIVQAFPSFPPLCPSPPVTVRLLSVPVWSTFQWLTWDTCNAQHSVSDMSQRYHLHFSLCCHKLKDLLIFIIKEYLWCIRTTVSSSIPQQVGTILFAGFYLLTFTECYNEHTDVHAPSARGFHLPWLLHNKEYDCWVTSFSWGASTLCSRVVIVVCMLGSFLNLHQYSLYTPS